MVMEMYQQEEKRVLASIVRTINLVIEVYHPGRVVIERELYFDLREIFAIQGIRVESAILRVNVETSVEPEWWQYIPEAERRGKLKVYFNGVKVHEAESPQHYLHALTLNINPIDIRRENRVRIEFEIIPGLYASSSTRVRMKLTRCELELTVSLPESQLNSLAVADKTSTERNRQYIESVISIPEPNKNVTPTTNPLSSFLNILGQLPSIVVAIVILFILIEIIRVFRR